jgi:hypothetical protein
MLFTVNGSPSVSLFCVSVAVARDRRVIRQLCFERLNLIAGLMLFPKRHDRIREQKCQDDEEVQPVPYYRDKITAPQSSTELAPRNRSRLQKGVRLFNFECVRPIAQKTRSLSLSQAFRRRLELGLEICHRIDFRSSFNVGFAPGFRSSLALSFGLPFLSVFGSSFGKLAWGCSVLVEFSAVGLTMYAPGR